MSLHKLCTVAIVIFGTAVTASLAHGAGRLDGSLVSLVQSGSQNDSLVEVLVLLENDQLRRSVSQVSFQPDLTRDQRIKTVTSRLKSTRAGESVGQFLREYADSYSRHWIIPAYTAMLPVGRLAELAALPEVNQVIPNMQIELTEPVEAQPSPSATIAVSSPLRQINVPTLWGSGLTGKGRLVCSFDTGVDRLHPALAAKWRGNHAPRSASFFSKVAPDSLPYDKVGHGTHTMGVMLGSTVTDSIGVAPDAEWICAAVIDQGPDLTTTISHILEAFEWALDPDKNSSTTDDVPDVILNSWGLPTLQPSVMAPCSTIFWDAIDNVEAAGIVTIFAAGNEGRSGAKTIRNPSNRATTPYNSFCVGAVNDQNVIADFSSRGPSSCDTTQVKPEVVAPGVGIRSSYKGGTYYLMSGTSMAAPFMAGLVALCRQYNPDATVEQIKYALMQSATDLGPAGEDNAYGWGLVDASKLLQYLPAPSAVHLAAVNVILDGDGRAMPGETVNIEVYLANAAGNIDVVSGQLTSLDPSATVISGNAGYIFGSGGTLAVNNVPFSVNIGVNAVHGSAISLRLKLSTSNGVSIDSIDLSLPIGFAPPGDIVTHHTGDIDFSVSEFGQFGLAEGSIYNAGGVGFRYRGSENLLYEAGIIVGRSSVQLSNSIRSEVGQFRATDFRPRVTAASWVEGDGSSHQTSSYTDNGSPLPIPVTIRQESIHFTGDTDNDFVILKFRIINNQPERLAGVYFGLLTDFDLSPADSMVYESGLGLMYQSGTQGQPMVGLMPLTGNAYFSVVDNGTTKTGMTIAQQYAMISSRQNAVNASARGDKMMAVHCGPFTLDPQDTAEVMVAVVAGVNEADLIAHAVRARERSDAVTGVDDNLPLPSSFTLAQNYPNPFNPSTTIAFELTIASDVSLDIYNSLGQVVTTLHKGRLSTGEHRFVWDGTDRDQQAVAAGVYFYRLTTGSVCETRKMVLLK